MKRTMLCVVAIAILTASVQIYAHHSDETVYRVRDRTEIRGTLSQIQIRNPHSWIFLDVPDQNKQTKRWGAEWRGATQLEQAGVNTNTLKIGEEVIVTGNPPRNPNDNRVRLLTIKRVSDGKVWGAQEGGE